MTQETQKKVQKKYRIAQVTYSDGRVFYIPEIRGASGLTGYKSMLALGDMGYSSRLSAESFIRDAIACTQIESVEYHYPDVEV